MLLLARSWGRFRVLLLLPAAGSRNVRCPAVSNRRIPAPRLHNALSQRLAIAAGKGEGLGKRRPELGRECILETAAGAQQSCLDGRGLEMERVGGRLDRHSLDFAENEN